MVFDPPQRGFLPVGLRLPRPCKLRDRPKFTHKLR